jgi:hypothetical protein
VSFKVFFSGLPAPEDMCLEKHELSKDCLVYKQCINLRMFAGLLEDGAAAFSFSFSAATLST